jgi:hypothetical protein
MESSENDLAMLNCLELPRFFLLLEVLGSPDLELL